MITEYEQWSLNNPLQMINGLNAPEINNVEKNLIEKAKPKKILDVGCGNGNRLFSFLNQADIEYVGIEKYERIAKSGNHTKDIVIGDISDVDVNNFSDVDTVTILGGSLFGLDGLDEQKKAWKNIVNIIPVGGHIIFDSSKEADFENAEEIGIVRVNPLAPPQFFLSEKQLHSIWNDLGLEIEEEAEKQIPGRVIKYYLLKKKK